jgi:diaminopropionate ammonia-lyase
MTLQIFQNPHVTSAGFSVGDATPAAFHRRLSGYAPTPLVAAPILAAALGLGQIWVKQESCRLGMPAFKILGASWATYRALERRLGVSLDGWTSLDELRAKLAALHPLTLAAATDGNHGRAVARMAALLGFEAKILVPTGTAQVRIDAIASEGAEVIIVDGSYDDAVALSAGEAGSHCLVISDTAWEGYEQVPHDVIEGYDTIFAEADAQLAALDVAAPTLILIQMGVGALAAAAIRHYRSQERATDLHMVGVEPDTAACVLAAMRAGQIVEVPGPHPSIMAGLNAGLASPVAWPDLQRGLDLFLAVPDEYARQAMRALAADGITAGETGAASIAGLMALMTEPSWAESRAALELGPQTQVLVVVSEGATDPGAYEQIVGRPPHYRCENPANCTCRSGLGRTRNGGG